MVEREQRWRLQALGALALIAPFNLVGSRSGGWLLLPLVAISLTAGALLTVWALLDRLDTATPPRLVVLNAAGAATLAAIWLSTLLGDDRWTSAGAAARVSVPLVLTIAAAHTIETDADVRLLLRRVVWGLGVALLIGASVLLRGGDALGTSRFFGRVTELGPYDRLTRPWSHANVAAMAIGLSALAVAVSPRRIRLVGLPVVVVAMIATYSRGGALALAVGGVVWALLRRRRPDTLAVAGLFVVAIIAIVVVPGWLDRTAGEDRLAWYRVEIEAPDSVEVAGLSTPVDVSIVNDSAVAWTGVGDDAVEISARWIVPGTDVVQAEQRWPLTSPLEPGDVRTRSLALDRIVPDGDYVIRWDLLIADEAYFRQFSGLPTIATSASVAGSGAPADLASVARVVPPREFLGRRVIFETAVDVWQTEPLVGVGPGRFGTSLPESTRVAHAHNVVLEPLATWGVIGTVPWLVVFVGSVVMAAQAAWRRRTAIACVIAGGLAIVAAHGVVDWPLVHVSVGIPLGLFMGAAWAFGSDPTGPTSLGSTSTEVADG